MSFRASFGTARALAIATVLGVVFGCSSPAPRLIDPGPAQHNPDWTKLESPDGTVSIAVPPDWRMWTVATDMASERSSIFQQFDSNPSEGGPSSEEIAQGLAQQAQSDPNASGLARSVEQLQADSEKNIKQMTEDEKREWAEKGLMIRACDSQRPIPGEPRTSFAIVKKPGGGSLEAAINDAKTGMQGDTKVRIIDLPIGKAGEIITEYQTIGGDQRSEAVYVLLDGHDKYVIKYITSNSGLNMAEVSAPMIKTLRIKRSKA